MANEVAVSRFGLERHLHEFLRENWDGTELGVAWTICEEDADPEAWYEYRAGSAGPTSLPSIAGSHAG